ncbi:MAG: hypothetical protein R3A51_11910 [Nannocystaceae bacterium]
MSRPRHSLRVITQPGLEEVTARELVALGLCPQAQAGAVVVTGGLRAVYAANLRLRTATRVLVQLARFEAPSFHALTRRLGDLDLDPWLPPAGVVHARATSHKSRLHHTGAIEARVIEALQARGREAAPGRAPGERPVAQLFVRLVRDRCTVSVDTSGAPLHRRGYRLAVAKAPLRETLAAAVVLESGYRPPAPLVDPLCGAGTLAIEAALLGRSLAPGRRRRFAFMDAAGFNRGLWASVVGEARAEEQTWPKPQVFASDRDAGAVAACRDNAARA